MWLKEDIVSLDKDKSELTSANLQLKNQLVQLKAELASLKKKKSKGDLPVDQSSLVANGKSHDQKPVSGVRTKRGINAPEIDGSDTNVPDTNGAGTSQSTPEPDDVFSDQRPDSKLEVMTVNYWSHYFEVSGEREVSRLDFPAGIPDIRRKARILAGSDGSSQKLDVRILLERDPSIPGRRFLFATEKRYPKWIQDIDGERVAYAPPKAGTAPLRRVKVFIFDGREYERLAVYVRSLAE